VMTVPVLAVLSSRCYQPPYEASARLLIQENRSVNPFLGDLMVDLQVENRFPVVANVLRSRTIAEEILRSLGEITPDSSPRQINSAVASFQDRMRIENTGGGVIGIQVRGSSPEQAYNRLERVMAALLEELLRPQRESLDGSVSFLEQQLGRMSRELSEAQNRIRVFKEQHAEELPEVFEGNLSRYLSTLAELQQAEADLGVAERQLTLSEAELAAYLVDPRLAELESELTQARNQRDALLASYTADHPRVIRAESRVRSLEEQLEERRRNPPSIDSLERQASARLDSEGGRRPRLVADDLMTGELLTRRRVIGEVESLRYRISRLAVQRDELRETIRSYAGNEQALNELTRDVEAKSALYNDLAGRYQDAVLTRELTLQSEAGRVWIIEAPSMPVDDNRVSMTEAGIKGLLLALVLAGVLIFGLELLDRTLRATAEVEELTGLPTIAVLPRLR
jgi:uncharacterized protein involved in exopolysaccharide biosynthesis